MLVPLTLVLDIVVNEGIKLNDSQQRRLGLFLSYTGQGQCMTVRQILHGGPP